jgi:glycosyltransferase involved in cell wall biosynthesis
MSAAPPIVSVITRTKNRPEFLREAVASVAAQTLRPIEQIVVNDGGDDVEHVVAPFRDRLDVRYLSPGAVGRCKAANVALAAARGTWIAWLDDDDLFYPHHLKTLHDFAEANAVKFVYGMADVIRQTKDKTTGRYVDVSKAPGPTFEFSRLRLWMGGQLHLVSTLHHREVYDRLGGFDEGTPVLEDLEFWGRVSQDYVFKRCATTTAAYRLRDDDTNAVYALRHQFEGVRKTLWGRYAHSVLPEIVEKLEHGETALFDLMRRVAELEAEVRRLKEGR